MQESVYGKNFTGLVEDGWTQKPYPVIVKAGVDDTSRDNSNVGKQIVCQRVKCALDQRKFVWKGWGTSDTSFQQKVFQLQHSPFMILNKKEIKNMKGDAVWGFQRATLGRARMENVRP